MKEQKSIKRLTQLTSLFFILISIGCTTQKIKEIPITTSSIEARELFIQGREFLDNNLLQENIQFMEKAIAKDSAFAMAYYYLALSQSNYDDFSANLNKAVSLADKVSEGEQIIIYAFQEEYMLNNLEKAQELYQKLVDIYPHDKQAHLIFGSFYYGIQEYNKAIEELQKAIEIDSDFASPYNMMGYSYSRIEQYTDAENTFRKYAELIPNAANPHDSYGEILMKQGKFDESIVAYRKALSIDPNFSSAYIGIGANLIFKGQSEKAREEFQKSYQVALSDGQRRQALLSIVNSYIYEGNLEKALNELQKCYIIDKNNNNLVEMCRDLTQMGDVLLESNKLDEAKTKYLKSLKLLESSEYLTPAQKDNDKLYHLFDEVQIALKEDDVVTAKAKAKTFREQAKDQIDTRTYHELMGMIALHEKRYDDALQELQQANQLNPRILYRLGNAYEGQGDKDKARKFWEKAVNFNAMSMNHALIYNKAKKKIITLN